jgi:arylsulfatase A-like enzyme
MKPLPLLTALLLSPLAALHAGDAPATQPNILFILADDMGYMDIGANNPRTFYETPNIDALAKRGMRFTQGYAACPVCSPTRGSILTGKYPPRFGVTAHLGKNIAGNLLPAPNKEHLGLEEVTIAEAMREAGYAILFAGKWHLGDGDYSPRAQGFGSELIGKRFSYYNAEAWDETNDPKHSDQIADEAVSFIEKNRDQPLFAYLSFHAVHTPIGVRADLVAKYEKKKTSAPPNQWGDERGHQVRLVQNHAQYAAMVEQMDSAIGRVLASLDRTGLGERTLVIFTSDNGGLSVEAGNPTSNLPLRAGKAWLYEGGIRTPWIIRAPGITQPDSVCETPVISTDFYPTMLDFTGLPQKPAQHLDGVSLVPLLKSQMLQRGPLFWHYPHYGNCGGAPSGAVRDGDWKLIEWFEDGQLELFNLRDDLGEKNNLITQQPDKANALHEKLIAWRKEVNAIMPMPNPDYQPGPAPSKTIQRPVKKKIP